MAAGSILGLLAWFSSAGAEAEEQAKADVVLRNGKIYTADKERSIKQAIAFRGNTIVAVGSDAIPSSARSTAPNAALPA
jgi:adenine deaminase